jgi:hypothetical protein
MRSVLSAVVLLAASNLSNAQGLSSVPENNGRPIVGTAGSLQVPNRSSLIGEDAGAPTKVHQDPMGKPCIKVTGSSRPQAINPKIFDHTVSRRTTAVGSVQNLSHFRFG